MRAIEYTKEVIGSISFILYGSRKWMKVRIIKYVMLICKVNALRQKLVIPHFFTKAIRFLVQPSINLTA